MEVYFEDFKEIVSRLESDNIRAQSYFDSLRNVDQSIVEFISENAYTDVLYKQNEFFLLSIVGEELKDWIYWYLYDVSLMNNSQNAWINEVGYTITDFNSFMDFAQHGLLLPMKPQLNIREDE